MEIVKELDQSERHSLRFRIIDHLKAGERLYLLGTHIDSVLIRKRHCFEVNIFVEDYDKISICAGPPITTPFHYYESLSKTIKYIQADQGFPGTLRPPLLNGQRVKEYWDQLSACTKNLPDCFSDLGICLLQDGVNHPSGGLNISEGMHKLVAYGLASNLDPIHFPISIYFGTDEDLRVDNTKNE